MSCSTMLLLLRDDDCVDVGVTTTMTTSGLASYLKKKIKFSYQGIVIARKMNDGKSFEFNFTITVAIRIASAIAIIMKK